MLAYFDADRPSGEGWQDPELANHLDSYAKNRIQRAEKIVEKLNGLGVPLTMQEVRQQAALPMDGKVVEKPGTIGRPHIAAALVAGKHVGSLDEAFSTFLKRGRPAWVDKKRVEAKEVIEIVHHLGGITSLAHPGFLRDENIPSQLLKDKLDGVEVYHSRHTSAQSKRLNQWAREHQLIITGGSDCHGNLKGEPLMGRVKLCGEDLERFLERLSS
jgi:3',5'-nucleoside bisphosphate phosphatase